MDRTTGCECVQHYCPEVAAVAKAFHKDFESKTLKTFEPEEFVEQAYEVTAVIMHVIQPASETVRACFTL